MSTCDYRWTNTRRAHSATSACSTTTSPGSIPRCAQLHESERGRQEALPPQLSPRGRWQTQEAHAIAKSLAPSATVEPAELTNRQSPTDDALTQAPNRP